MYNVKNKYLKKKNNYSKKKIYIYIYKEKKYIDNLYFYFYK